MFQNSIHQALLLLSLLVAISPLCLQPTELDGLCTSCPTPQTLMHGFCVTPIPGCLDQLSSNLCNSCSSGYTLSHKQCLPPGSQQTTIGYVDQYLSTYADKGLNYAYELLDFHFKGKYPSELDDKISNITMVSQL